jgi:GNAT superfamily N-acetyltransferase
MVQVKQHKKTINGKTINVKEYKRKEPPITATQYCINSLVTKSEKKGVSSSVEYNKEYIVLSKLIVDSSRRGLGLGTEFMNNLIYIADRDNKDIMLTPTSDFGGNNQRRNKFYKHFGFKKNNDYSRSETLVRNPNL